MAGSVTVMETRNDKLLTALLSGMTIKQAASHSGYSERTVRRRIGEPAFAQRLAAARAELMTATLDRLTFGSTRAAVTLIELLNARAEHVRHSAARSIIELSLRIREQQDVLVRLEALEAQLAGADVAAPLRRIA